MSRRKAIGYVVEGIFKGSFERSHWNLMLLQQDGTLAFAGSAATVFPTATVFPNRPTLNKAVRLTIGERTKLFGKNDLLFNITRL